MTVAATVPSAVAVPLSAYLLDQPAQVLVQKDGSLLVAERGSHDRVLRVNPATGATTVAAVGIDEPWGLAYARDGSVLVSSTTGLYRLHPRARVAAVSVSPFVPLPDGRIAYANETSAGLISGGKARAWPVAVNVPHGLALLPDGALALSDTGNSRILRIDPATGTETTITSAVSTALGLAAEPSGSLLTVEYGKGRLLRVDPAGTITVVARGLHKPYALARTPAGSMYVTEAGGTIRRIQPNGRSSLVPLNAPRRTMGLLARPPALQQPFDLLPLGGGKYAVTDLPANAVYELDPARKTGRLLARISQARELERLKDGRLLVTSRARVLALNPRTGKTTLYTTAKNYLLGIALAPDGWLYGSENVPGSEQTTLVRIRGGTREVLGEFHGVHGILYTPGGLILGEAYAGRVLRFDPETRQTEVLAEKLGNPGFALPAAAGGYFVSEFFGNRISHVWPDGHVTTVANVIQPGPIVFDAQRRITGVTLVPPTLFRVARGKAVSIYP